MAPGLGGASGDHNRYILKIYLFCHTYQFLTPKSL